MRARSAAHGAICHWSLGGGVLAVEKGVTHFFTLDAPRGATAGAAGDGAILSPMPGRVIAVDVAAGDAVTKGQKLLTLEAMKMEHGLVAPFDGTVAELNATTGGQVSEGTCWCGSRRHRLERRPSVPSP